MIVDKQPWGAATLKQPYWAENRCNLFVHIFWRSLLVQGQGADGSMLPVHAHLHECKPASCAAGMPSYLSTTTAAH